MGLCFHGGSFVLNNLFMGMLFRKKPPLYASVSIISRQVFLVNRIFTKLQKYGKVAMVGDGINDAPALG